MYVSATDAGYTPNTLAQFRWRRIDPSDLKVRSRILDAIEELDHWVEGRAPVEKRFAACSRVARNTN